ncbi:DUF6114 domain-containing protein [Kitasatospora camelliae]|uniref:DUF6114 domain-containing protein n=1 Tax=Kitasatospora camelliae TaxID=3156397 RepID=A0AAU8JZP7_9ACTN
MSSATADAWPVTESGPTGFRRWRRTRPFWGGLLAMIAGLPILYFPYAHLSFNGMTIAMATTAGAGSMIIGLMLIALGLTAWFQPMVRIFCGVATTILSLVSIPVSNLGGFGLGLVLGLVAGGLLVSWAPVPVLPEAAVAESVADIPAQATAAEAPAEQTLEYGAAPKAGEPGEQQ